MKREEEILVFSKRWPHVVRIAGDNIDDAPVVGWLLERLGEPANALELQGRLLPAWPTEPWDCLYTDGAYFFFFDDINVAMEFKLKFG